MNMRRSFPVTFLLIALALTVAGLSLAADVTNPSGSTVVGLIGTADDDTYINQGTVNGDVSMLQGGQDVVNNSGSITGDINMGGGGYDTVVNSGSVTGNVALQDEGTMTNTASGTIGGSILANILPGNSGAHSFFNYGVVTGMILGNILGSGDVYIYNAGSVGSLSGNQVLGEGNVVIVNYGNVTGDIYGQGATPSSSVPSISITNYGKVGGIITGTENRPGNVYINNASTGVAGQLIGSSAGDGSVYIINSGTANLIAGSSDASGDVTIVNSSTGLTGSIIGATNFTGNVSINNSGTVLGNLIGAQASTGNVSIVNSGSVGGILAGGFALTGNVNVINSGSAVGLYGGFNVIGNVYVLNSVSASLGIIGNQGGQGNVTIINTGYVGSVGITGIAGGGTGNAYIFNSGTVLGGITAGPGDDTVVLAEGSSVGGVVDGSDGTDTLVFQGMGTLNSVAWGSTYINFENLGFQNGTTTLTGDWDLGSGTVLVNSGGTVILASGASLRAYGLTINYGGTANIYGSAVISGPTSVGGQLSVASGGTLSTGTLAIAQGGRTDVAGTLTTGSTSVDGLLHVNGTLVSPSVTIGSTGYLWGTGLLQGSLVSYGTLAPGNSIGTLTIQGSLTMQPGSVYQAQLASDGASDLIRVLGPATINGGWVSTSLPQALYPDRFSWKILSATGGVSGGFDGVDGQPNSQTLSLHAITYDDHVSLEVWRKPYASFGAGPDARAVGGALDRLVPLAAGRQDDLANLMLGMDWTYSQPQIASALQRLSPEMYTSYLQAGLEGSAIFGQALERRVQEVRRGRQLGLAAGPQGAGALLAVSDEAAPLAEPQGSPPGSPDWNFWGEGLGSWSRRAASSGYLGYSQRLGGLAGGVDGRLNDWLLVGLGVGASKSSLEWGQPYLSGGLRGLHTGVYTGVELGGLHAQASLAYSEYQANGRRDIDLPGVSHLQATGDSRSRAGLADLNAGYDWRLAGWLAGPTAGFSYAKIQQDGFQETGAGGLSLGLDDGQQESLTSRLGLQAASKLELGAWQFSPSLSLEWQHQYHTARPGLDARFPGCGDAAFKVEGLAPVADLAMLRAGLSTRLRDRLALFADLGLAQGHDYNAQSVQFGLQYAF